MSILNKIKMIEFPTDQYIKQETLKSQIVIHHTASGSDEKGDVLTWKNDPRRIATPIIITRDGTPHQLYSTNFWAYHLGVNKRIEMLSIGVELDSWGPLIKKGEDYYSWTGSKLINPKVTEYKNGWGRYPNSPFFLKEGVINKPIKYFESYTPQQIETLCELIQLWHQRRAIPKTYNEDMWNVSQRAISGAPGIWAHCSYVPKTDAHPQPELIEALKQL